MELVSEHYRVCIDDQGLATVWKRELQVLVRTTLASGGQPQVESFTRAEAPDAATRQLLEHFDRTPFAQFAYAGEGHWHLDCEAGFQRWKGYVSGRSLSGSLERMGFAQDARNRILKACRAEIHAYMARAC
ncbi:MAG: hypothetical protein HS116_19295 [Planctomycetes bacterium]|nr:hypothetical protein [Planctomycetota bacterium]